MEEVLEDGEQVVLVVVPPQAVLLRWVAQQHVAATARWRAGVGTRIDGRDAAGGRGHRRGPRRGEGGGGGHLRGGCYWSLDGAVMHRGGRRGSESRDEREVGPATKGKNHI